MLSKSMCAVLGALFALSVATVQKPGAEPPLRIKLTLGGQQQQLALGQPFQVTLDGKQYGGLVEAAPTRQFEHLGVRFEYPSHYAYDYIPQEGVTMFSVEGVDGMVLLQVFDEELSAELALQLVADGVLAQYRGLETGREEVSMRLQGQEVAGVRLTVRMGTKLEGVAFRQDFHAFEREGSTVVICIQDNLEDDGQISRESRRVRDLLERTFAVR